jgi:hypothetical protein
MWRFIFRKNTMLRFTRSLLTIAFGCIACSFSVIAIAQDKAENDPFKYPVFEGVMTCDDAVTVVVVPDKKVPHHFVLSLGKVQFKSVRVPTSSGAIRLEDKAHGIVWLQMSNKSMLFNEKAGKRLAHNCRNALQAQTEKELIATDAPNILDSLARKDPTTIVTP